jgi:hypothetical protein
MLTLDLEDFMIELKEGTVKHVGTSNTAATVKLYDVESVETREFGDERVKVSCEDDGGNEVEIALDPEDALSVASEIERLAEDSRVFEE